MPKCPTCSRHNAWDSKTCPGCGKQNPSAGAKTFLVIAAISFGLLILAAAGS